MSDMPSRVRLDPDYNGHQRQVVGWASDVPVDDEHGWTEYVRADLSDALLREAVAVLDWYAENSRLARLIHSEGDKGRNAIAQDGGKSARATLAKLRSHMGGNHE